MTVYTFQDVDLTGVKNVPCAGCGKKIRRQKRFYQTLNPWNVNEDGTARSREQIRDVLRGQIAVWMQEPERHGACAE